MSEEAITRCVETLCLAVDEARADGLLNKEILRIFTVFISRINEVRK